MKKLLLFIALSTLSINGFSRESKFSCGVRETAASLATIDMELELLNSGLYDIVRRVALIKIAEIVQQHLLQADVCSRKSEALKQAAIDSINILVLYNSDPRDYSLNTARRIFLTIRENVRRMDENAGGNLDHFFKINAGASFYLDN